MQRVRNDKGRRGRVKFSSRLDYESFKLAKDSKVFAAARQATRELGINWETKVSNGGQDANWLNAHGIETITLGAGAHEAHTVSEYLEIAEFLDGCRLALHLATNVS